MQDPNNDAAREAGQSDESEILLRPDAVANDDHRNPRRRQQRESATAELGTLVEPQPQHDLARLILHKDAREEIMAGVRAITQRADLERIWNIGLIQPQAGRCILNFYGEPGTGKTRAALGVALLRGQALYHVDYSAVISKYLGDTAEHIAACFQRARGLGAVLFFDEADSLLSRRVAIGESCATSINQNRNVLMQELDRFDGVVIVTTNLFGNYDPALLRRINRHIEFKLPHQAMRRKLLELHLPNLQRVFADLDVIAGETKGFSGGDILNVCVNAIYAGSTHEDPEQWMVSSEHLMAEVRRVRAAKINHSGGAR
jgi:ATP-dependent 26S proteasome regulatory subunit